MKPSRPARITHVNLPTPAALGRALAQAIHAQQATASTQAKGQANTLRAQSKDGQP